MRTLALFTILFASAIARDLYFCEIKTTIDDAKTEKTLRLGSSSYSFDNFNLVSFGGYSGNTGDIEGRGAVKGSVSVGNGYSFGYELRTGGPSAVDRSLPYSLVAGGDVTWGSGALYPQGDNIPYYGAKEDALIGGTFNAPGYLQTRRSGSSSTLDADFAAGQTYFGDVQNAFASMTPNLIATAQWSGIFITCPSTAANTWVVNLDASDINQATYWSKTGCNDAASFVFNIGGTGDVTFSGGNFVHRAEKILFNILGSGRTINLDTRMEGSFLAPNNKIARLTGVVVGHIIVGDIQNVQQINRLFCAPPASNPVVEPCVGFESDCAGLDLSSVALGLSFKDFNAISFGNFKADTGDVEGRLAVKGSATFGNGYSIGGILSTNNNQPDASKAYALVVGQDLTWGSGELHPRGDGFPFPGAREDAYVAGTASVANNLQERVVTGSNVDALFDAAKTCYQGYSDNMATKTDTVTKRIADSGLFLTCSDRRATSYVVSISDTEFSQFTYTVTDNCNFQSRWIINVRGTGDVDITGDSFPGVSGAIVYNIIGSRTVKVHDTSLNGHLLAPSATLNQQNGVIVGKVIANDVAFSLQINSMNSCPVVKTVTVNIVAKGSSAAGVFTVSVYGADDLRVNDLTSIGKIVAINDDFVTFSSPLSSSVSDGQVIGTATWRTIDGRGQVPNQEVSSASVAGLAIASFVVAALVL